MSLENAPEVNEETSTVTQEFVNTLMGLADEDAASRETPKEPSEGNAPETPPASGDKTEPPAAEAGKGEAEAEGDKAGGEKTPDLSEELLTRIVKARIPLRDAREMKPDVLERILTSLEKATAEGSKKEEPANTQGKPEEGGNDPLAIFDLDPEEYDEKVVAAMKASKQMISELRKEIDGLKSSKGEAPPTESWVDQKIKAMGADYEKLFADAGNKAKLERYIQFVKTDADAEGATITDSDAFDSAISLAFSDHKTTLKGKAAQQKAAERATRALNQPRGTNGKFSSENPRGMSDAARDEDALKTLTSFFTTV